MAKIRIKGDTSGYIDIEAPAEAGATTLSLPATAGNILTSADVLDSDQIGTGAITAAKISDGEVSEAKLATGAVTSAKIASGAVEAAMTTQIGGRRNLIINGAMQVAQRGTSAAGVTSNGYHTVDRWYTQLNSAGTWTITQETDAPDGFGHSMKYLCTSGFTQVSQTRLLPIYYFEGQNVQQLKYGTSDAQPVTLSFWVKCNKTGVGQVNARNVDANRINGGTYTVNSANTWEYKTITFSGDTVSSITNDNTVGFWIEWWLVSGSDFDTGSVPTSYEFRNNSDRDAAGTLDLDATNDYWQITGVQLEVGDTATPFEHRSYGEELAACQRYFQKYTGVSTNSTFPNTAPAVAWTTNNTSNGAVGAIVPLRVAPTVSESGLQLRSPSDGTFSATFSFSSQNINGTMVSSSLSSGLIAGNVYYITPTSTSSYIQLDAEL